MTDEQTIKLFHDLKNDLASMTSLLNLHKLYKNISAEEVLNRLFERQTVIATAYEKLYQENNFPLVRLPVLINDLLMRVNRTLCEYCSGISLVKDIADISIVIKQATALSQILVELISNSYRHAFINASGAKKIEFRILNKDDKLFFTYTDNGCGLQEGFVPGKSRTLGMQFIHSLSKQLGGVPVFGEKPEGGMIFSLETDIRKD